MPTLLARWHLAAQQAHDNHPTLARYLLIDAAQLSINALPWKDLLACRQIDNLLKGRPEASAPEICGLLMPYEHHWVAPWPAALSPLPCWSVPCPASNWPGA